MCAICVQKTLFDSNSMLALIANDSLNSDGTGLIDIFLKYDTCHNVNRMVIESTCYWILITWLSFGLG